MNKSIRPLPTLMVWSASIAVLLVMNSIASRAYAADRTWSGGGADNNWSTPANWGGTAPSAGDSLFFDGSVRTATTNDFPAGTLFNGISFNTTAGGFILRGNSLTLGGDIVDNTALVPHSFDLPLTLNATHNVNVVLDGLLTISGVISDSGAGLNKTGAGQLVLTAANTFGGPVTISAGTLSIASDSNLGAAPASPTPGRLVIDGGALRATANLTLHANRGIALGPTAGTGEGIFDIGAGLTLSYGGVIANNGGGTGGLTKLKFGGLTLSGANTFTGPTAVKNGTLMLDFTQATSPVDSIINPSSALILNGATAAGGTTNFAALIMNGKDGAANSQTFNGATVVLGQAQIRANSGTGGSANIALGLLTHQLGGVVNIIPPGLIGGTGNITTTAGNLNSIIGGWAMVSDGTISLQGGTTGNPIPPAVATNFAAVDPSGNILSYTDDTVYNNTIGNVANVLWGTNNVLIDSEPAGDLLVNDDGAGTTHDVNTLTFNRGFNWGLKIGANNVLRLGKTGALFSQHRSSSPTWGITASAAAGGGQGNQDVGTLTAGGPEDNMPGEIIVHLSQAGSASANNMVIDSRITDNGTGPVTLVKAGPGFMKLRGHNTYSGGTYLLQGRIQLSGSEVGTSNPDGIGTGPLFIFPGGYLFMSGTGSTITNDLFIAGDAARQEQGIGAIRTSGGWVIAGTVTLIGDATIGGNGQLTGPIAGRITGPYNLALCSAGTVNGSISIANPSNDWSGNTIIQARNNQGNNTFNSGTNECIPNGLGKGNTIMLGYSTGTITWNLNGFSETVNGLLTSVNGLTCTIQNNVASTTSTLTVGDHDQSATFGGAIRDNGGIVALTKIGGGRQTLTGANGYTGATTVNGGTLAVSGSGSIASSQEILVNEATLDVAEVAGGFAHPFPISVTNGALVVRNTVSPGIAALTLTDARVRVSSLGAAPIVVETTALTTGGQSNLIDIVSIGAISGYPAQFTVIKYSGFIDGAGFNFGLGTVPTASTVGFISNNVDNASVDLVLLDGPKTLSWVGAINDDWDINTTINWLAFGVTPSVYLDVDSVRFDDAAVAKTVDLTTTLQPGSVTVSNQIANYTFSGPGSMTGPTGLTKDGNASLILDNSGINDFFGPVTINAGTVQVGNNSMNGSLGAGAVINNSSLVFARSDDVAMANTLAGAGTVTQNGPGILTLSGDSGSFTGSVIIAQSTLKPGSSTAFGAADGGTTVLPGATLDLNGQSLGGEPVTVSGAGVGSNGAIVNSGGAQLNALRSVTLAADTTFGGTTRWDIRNAGGDAGLSSGGQPYKITKVGPNQVSLVGVNVEAALGDIEILEGRLGVETTTTQLGDPFATLTVHSNATLGLFNLNMAPLNKQIVLRDGATVLGENSRSVIAGPITLEGRAAFNVATAGTAPALEINNPIEGSGGLNKIGSGPLVLKGANTYAGPTLVSNGTLVVDGSIRDSSITVHGGRLGGVGSIFSPVTIAAGGTLAPGNAEFPIGALTIDTTLTLAGTTLMDVSRSGGGFMNDQVSGFSTLTYGGTLQLNLTGEPLVAGDVITLFSFSAASGAFATIVPAIPGTGLVWDASQLTVDGSLRVMAAIEPEIASITRSDNDVVISGAGGPPGGTYHVLSSTNVALPVMQWTPVATNLFDASGNFNFSTAIDPAAPQRFFLLQLP